MTKIPKNKKPVSTLRRIIKIVAYSLLVLIILFFSTVIYFYINRNELTKDLLPKLNEIQNGEFAREFILENQAGAATLKAKRRLGREHPIEIVGAKLRGMMSWINEGKIVDKNVN